MPNGVVNVWNLLPTSYLHFKSFDPLKLFSTVQNLADKIVVRIIVGSVCMYILVICNSRQTYTAKC